MVLIIRPTLALLAASASLRPSLASTTALVSSSYCPYYPPTHTGTAPLNPSQRRFSVTVMATAEQTTTPASAEFVQEHLSALLKSPYIHFTQPQIPGIRLGHGPVDLFSTRFANFFTHDATGAVAGRELDRDGLKRALLALQKRWDPDSARFVAQGEASKPSSKFVWTQKDAGSETEVTASADVKEEGGTQRIHRLTLDGDQALFS